MVIGLIILIGLVGFRFNLQQVNAAGRKYVLIYVQNEPVTELSLALDDQYAYTLRFGEQNQHSAEVEVENGRVRMLPMEEELCPRAICSHTGWISQAHESIVCLPNRIMIFFSDTPDHSDDIDGITY